MSLFPKVLWPWANWPSLRISPHSSLNVIYCLIITAWQLLMSFTYIPVQIEPNKSPLSNGLKALLLWEIGHLSSSSGSILGRLILICSRQGGAGALWVKPPHTLSPSRHQEGKLRCLSRESVWKLLWAEIASSPFSPPIYQKLLWPQESIGYYFLPIILFNLFKN